MCSWIAKLSASATLLVVIAWSTTTAQSQTCPTINGKFEMKTEASGRPQVFMVTLYTKQDGDQFSYTVNLEKRFDPADGKLRPLRVGDRYGHARVYCTRPNTVVMELKADDTGNVTTSKITPVSATAIYVESFDPIGTGTYVLRP